MAPGANTTSSARECCSIRRPAIRTATCLTPHLLARSARSSSKPDPTAGAASGCDRRYTAHRHPPGTARARGHREEDGLREGRRGQRAQAEPAKADGTEALDYRRRERRYSATRIKNRIMKMAIRARTARPTITSCRPSRALRECARESVALHPRPLGIRRCLLTPRR